MKRWKMISAQHIHKGAQVEQVQNRRINGWSGQSHGAKAMTDCTVPSERKSASEKAPAGWLHDPAKINGNEG